MTRRVVDCFTTDALRQIQSAVNGEEYVNEYRGGMGSDIRYLSDFAVEQIKNAVTVNGGGGGKEMKSVWAFSVGEAPQKIEPTFDSDYDTFNYICDFNNGIISYWICSTDEPQSNDDVLISATLQGETKPANIVFSIQSLIKDFNGIDYLIEDGNLIVIAIGNNRIEFDSQTLK